MCSYLIGWYKYKFSCSNSPSKITGRDVKGYIYIHTHVRCSFYTDIIKPLLLIEGTHPTGCVQSGL